MKSVPLLKRYTWEMQYVCGRVEKQHVKREICIARSAEASMFLAVFPVTETLQFKERVQHHAVLNVVGQVCTPKVPNLTGDN
jgi:hypothetical protein